MFAGLAFVYLSRGYLPGLITPGNQEVYTTLLHTFVRLSSLTSIPINNNHLYWILITRSKQTNKRQEMRRAVRWRDGLNVIVAAGWFKECGTAHLEDVFSSWISTGPPVTSASTPLCALPSFHQHNEHQVLWIDFVKSHNLIGYHIHLDRRFTTFHSRICKFWGMISRINSSIIHISFAGAKMDETLSLGGDSLAILPRDDGHDR